MHAKMLHIFCLIAFISITFGQSEPPSEAGTMFDWVYKTIDKLVALKQDNTRQDSKIKQLETKLEDALDTIDELNFTLNNKRSHDWSGTLTEMSPPFNYVLKVEDLEYDNWKMLFRATAGNGYNVLDAWTYGRGACDNKPETMERSLLCHFRSNLVTSWSDLQVDKVKFALYNPDREVGHVIFNGRDTDLLTWFDKSRIVSSSWSDLTPTNSYNVFSVSGHYRAGQYDRRFYISRAHGGCDKDTGHVVTLDTLTVPTKACRWDKMVAYPQFLYSKINSADIWNDGFCDRAEYMAIFIKTYSTSLSNT